MDDGICPPWWPNFLWWLIHAEEHALEKLKQGVEELSGIAARPTATVA